MLPSWCGGCRDRPKEASHPRTRPDATDGHGEPDQFGTGRPDAESRHDYRQAPLKTGELRLGAIALNLGICGPAPLAPVWSRWRGTLGQDEVIFRNPDGCTSWSVLGFPCDQPAHSHFLSGGAHVIVCQ